MAIGPGQVLGDRFEVLGELGRGGTATVWLAHDRLRDERVALKVLHAHLADSPVVASRLRREVQAAGRVRHEAALVAHELHELDGRLVLCMPYHPGTSLAEHVATHGPWTGQALLGLGRRLSQALAAAHRAGVVHRDVTPGNVLVDDDESAVLTDFGLARVDGRHTATATSVMGTPGYAAPELFDGIRGDPRTDLYGLGATLYLAATGQPPFGTGAPAAVLRRQLDGDRQTLSSARPDLPPHLTATVDALLATDPADRPPSAREVDQLLATARRPSRPRHHREPDDDDSHSTEDSQDRRPTTDDRTPRAHLPPGDHRVVVREREDDKWRRGMARRQHVFHTRVRKRLPRHMRRHVDRVADVVVPTMELLSGTPIEGRKPERALAQAVAREASLPHEALAPAGAMHERRFRLVDGVDARVAAELVRSAQAAGFRARSEAVTALQREGMKLSQFLMAFVLPAFIVGVLPAPNWIAMLILGIGALVMLASHLDPNPRVRRRRSDRYPLAYGDDLRPHLRRGFQDLLPPPPAMVGVLPPAPAAKTPPKGRHTEDATPEEPTVQDQVVARIERLATTLDAEGEHLPPGVRGDLQRSTKTLAREVVRLRAHLAQLDRELAAHGTDAALERTVGQLQARLRRLETLQRAGTDVDAAELAQLRRTLDGHHADLAAGEDLERRRVETMARLVELGTAANSVRRELFGATPPTMPLGDVVRRLKDEARAASQAIEEVEARGRARRAEAAQAPPS